MRLMYKAQLVALWALPLLANACALDDKSGFDFAGFANKTLALASENYNSEIPGTIDDVVLGTAYHSGEESFRNVVPVTGLVDETQGNAETVYALGVDLSYLEVISRINGTLDGNGDIKVVKAGVSASAAIDQAATEYSNNYHFFAAFTHKKSVLRPDQNTGTYMLTPEGQLYADDYQDQLFDKVGDEFVSAIEYGAWINVNLKLEYRNQQDKNLISGRLYLDANGVVNMEKTLQYLDVETKQSVIIKVQAGQKGGDPLQLLEIIPGNLKVCTLEEAQPCADIFAALVQYGKNDFPGQLTGPDRYSVLSYTTQRYEHSGLGILTPNTYPGISLWTRILREELDEKYRIALRDHQRASNLITMYSGFLTGEELEKLENIEEKASANVSLYSELGINCFNNPYDNSCQDYYNQVKAQGLIKEYDDRDLNITTYANPELLFRCENAMQAAIDAGWITLEFAEIFRGYGWAPIYVDNANPAGDIVNWVACSEAILTYGDYFYD